MAFFKIFFGISLPRCNIWGEFVPVLHFYVTFGDMNFLNAVLFYLKRVPHLILIERIFHIIF